MSTPACKHDWQFVQGLTERLRCTRCGLMTWPKDADEKVQEMLTDALVTGTGMLRVSSEGVERIDPATIYKTEDPAIHFCHRFAILMECVMLGGVDKYWDEMGTLLDEYHKARDTWAEAQGQPYVSGFGKD